MNSKLVRFVAAVATGALITVGASVLTANADTPGKGGTGSASSTMTAQAAEQIQKLYVQLDEAARAGDVAAVEGALDQLQPSLTLVRSVTADRAAIDLVSRADSEATSVKRTLPGLPLPLPDPISLLTGLLKSLLATLAGLLGSLLGAVPIPVPVPELPVPLP